MRQEKKVEISMPNYYSFLYRNYLIIPMKVSCQHDCRLTMGLGLELSASVVTALWYKRQCHVFVVDEGLPDISARE